MLFSILKLKISELLYNLVIRLFWEQKIVGSNPTNSKLREYG